MIEAKLSTHQMEKRKETRPRASHLIKTRSESHNPPLDCAPNLLSSRFWRQADVGLGGLKEQRSPLLHSTNLEFSSSNPCLLPLLAACFLCPRNPSSDPISWGYCAGSTKPCSKHTCICLGMHVTTRKVLSSWHVEKKYNGRLRSCG